MQNAKYTLDELIKIPISWIDGTARPATNRQEVVTRAKDWPRPVLVIREDGSHRNLIATSYSGG